MAWMETSVVDQRLEFVVLASSGGASMAELCRRFDISRKTGYKWLGRYDAGNGQASVSDASRRPRTSPLRSPAALEEQVVQVRQAHPAWGGRKIAYVLGRDAGVQVAPSTVTSILRRRWADRGGRQYWRPRPGSALSTKRPTACGRWTSRGTLPCTGAAATL